VRFAAEADIPAEALDDVPGNAQPQPEMLPVGIIFQRWIGLGKGFEHMFAKFLGYPRALIRDTDACLFTCLPRLDHDPAIAWRVTQCIAQQVEQNLNQSIGIDIDPEIHR
jgi:hypothetical protein